MTVVTSALGEHVAMNENLICLMWRGRRGGGEEPRSGTENRCSHNLQSGHPAWWSAGNWCFSVGTLSTVIKVYQECI